jgi:hemerythrin
MAIEWTNDLATGVAEIDGQHRELFQRVNGLMEACKQGKGRTEVEKVLTFLEDYVVEHFSAEEDYMVKFSYPAYAAHKAQHLEFLEKFSGLKHQLEREGAGVLIVVKTNQVVVDWLKNHIRKTDKTFAAFLAARR